MIHKNKRFLNDSTFERGSITWYISTEFGSEYYSCEGDISISDCSNTIELDLNSKTPKQIKKRIDKVSVLIEELEKVKAALIIASTPAKCF